MLYKGDRPPFDLRWDRRPGTHRIGYRSKGERKQIKPVLSKREANATPREFAKELMLLAMWSRNPGVYPRELRPGEEYLGVYPVAAGKLSRRLRIGMESFYDEHGEMRRVFLGRGPRMTDDPQPGDA